MPWRKFGQERIAIPTRQATQVAAWNYASRKIGIHSGKTPMHYRSCWSFQLFCMLGARDMPAADTLIPQVSGKDVD